MVMKLYPEFEPAIQFAKTVGEAEYAKLMELYTAWKSGAFSNSVELGTYYGRQPWDDVDADNWPSDLKAGDMFLGAITGATYVYVADTNTFYPISNIGYRGEYSAYEKYIVGQMVTDTDGNLYICIAANMLEDGLKITEYSIGCALDDTFYWALLSSSSNGGGVTQAVAWADITSKPNTLSGFGITDALLNMRPGVSLDNIALGTPATQGTMINLTTGWGNLAVGSWAIGNLTTGYRNVVLGNEAAATIETGCDNVLIGVRAGDGLLSASDSNVCIGYYAGSATNKTCTNIVAIGANAQATGSNQVQLGNSSTTTYVYGTVQNRSDIRDKIDVTDSSLGIDFILGLRPVEGKWDLREDYIDVETIKDAEGKTTVIKTVLPKDGSRKRKRKHQWFIAQEVKTLCDTLGVDFGGYQDHSIDGGADVLSLGYDEFIPPAVKAIQECWQRLDKLEERISKLEQ